MKTILSEKIVRIVKNRKRLEKVLNLKINNNGKDVSINGTPEDEDTGEKVIDAMNFGFSYTHAITIKTENRVFEIINIKNYSKKHDRERIRGRLIGKHGKALSTLSKLADSYLEMNENQIGLITFPENLKFATEAIVLIIQGSKHSNVYKGMEKNQPRPVEDLGLRDN